jgi:2-C-methyl-D-erythritol 4-phosphate cytidylyltransferase
MGIIRDILRKNLRTSAIILAAGSSTRMGGGSKQFMEINGVPCLARTLLAFEGCRNIDDIIIVAKRGEEKACLELARAHGITKLLRVVTGGANRTESAMKGFSAVPEESVYVAIHDGARPLITPLEITNVIFAAEEHKCASAATRITDTVKKVKKDTTFVEETLDRSHLFAVQTPQVFYRHLYEALAISAKRDEFTATDDASIAEHYGHRVKLVETSRENIKITTPFDISLAEVILSRREKIKEDVK